MRQRGRDQPLHAAAVELGRGATARRSAMTVATMATTIAASFKTVGLVENRVSITADSRQSRRRRAGQVGEHADDRGTQVRVGEPAAQWLARRRSVSPTNVANVPASDEVISMR